MTTLSPPSKWLWAAEFPRAAWGLAEFAASQPKLRAAPRGDGRPVMILPGLMTNDGSNWLMRNYLRRLGYRVEGWGLGLNRGARVVGSDAEVLMTRIREVHARTGEPVTLIGVSLGGIMARIAAHRLPGLVREVITVSAPYAGSARATNVWRSFEFFTGEKIDDAQVRENAALAAKALPVPETAIWSRSDGLVNGAICRASGARAIEVRSSHMGVQWRRDVMLAIAGVLGGRD